MSTPSPRTRRRADAERSIARIVAAARERLSADPSASTENIARAAGVGRMTLYGHFRDRSELVEAALAETLQAGEEVLRDVDLTGDPREALRSLLGSSWTLVAESASLLAAADGVVPDSRLRELHENPARRMEELLRRGQREGVFRVDLSLPWLVSAIHYLLHGAASEVRAGRLPASNAAEIVTRTIESVVLPASGADRDG